MTATHNGCFVQSARTEKPTPVGFFAPAAHQMLGVWYTTYCVRGFTRSPLLTRKGASPNGD
jgi:hypothetical protein